MIATMPPSTTTKKKSTRAPAKAPEPAGRKRSALTEAGEEAKRDAMRKLLLRTLKEQGWNLTRTAEALRMGEGSGAASNVAKALLELAPEEYAAAKADGRITNYRRAE